MIPKHFKSKYPCLAVALSAMKFPDDSGNPLDTAAQKTVNLEIEAVNRSGESLLPVVEGLFEGPPQPDDNFMRFSMAAGPCLGFSDGVHAFMGHLWADSMKAWTTEDCARFLQLMLKDSQMVFQALDYAAELFARRRFAADEVLPWIFPAHGRVKNDLMQRGFWACIQAFCKKSPAQAIVVAERALSQITDTSFLSVIANMLGSLRLVIGPEHSASEALIALEENVKAPGFPERRALYVQSWACAAGKPLLSKDTALQIRDQFIRPDSDEEDSWCFLLNAIIQKDRSSWSWAHRELERVVRPGLSDTAKHWTAKAALYGLETADANDAISGGIWHELFALTLPIAASNNGTWEVIQDTLVKLAKNDPASMRQCVRVLAQRSGDSWLDRIEQQKFSWFFVVLSEIGMHIPVAGDLCFQSGSGSRRLGLIVLDECRVEKLASDVVTAANDAQLELLFLEAQRRFINFLTLARLHACLAERIDQVGGDFATRFYKEVETQCLNTESYRIALIAAAPKHDRVQVIAITVTERLTATQKAASSPALQMEVPGRGRGESLYEQRIARNVAKGVRQQSILSNLTHNISLLYSGDRWRMFGRDGVLSEPVELHSYSTEFEVPKLEVFDPEGSQGRRIEAASRIAALEAHVDPENGKP